MMTAFTAYAVNAFGTYTVKGKCETDALAAPAFSYIPAGKRKPIRVNAKGYIIFRGDLQKGPNDLDIPNSVTRYGSFDDAYTVEFNAFADGMKSKHADAIIVDRRND